MTMSRAEDFRRDAQLHVPARCLSRHRRARRVALVTGMLRAYRA
jgi:hypothetical protein